MIEAFVLGFFIPIMIGIPSIIGFFFAEELSNISGYELTSTNGGCIGWIIGIFLASPIFFLLCTYMMLPILTTIFLSFAFMTAFLSIPLYILNDVNHKSLFFIMISTTIISLIVAELFRQATLLIIR